MNLGNENERLEFKKSTSEMKEAMQSIVAILNKHGSGELYFGVNNNGTPVGQQIGEDTLRKISQAVAEHVTPAIYPTIEVRYIDNASIIYVKFNGEDKPYFARGRAYIRVFDEDRQITVSELEKMFLSKNSYSSKWDSLPSDKTVDDIDEKILIDYIKRANEAKRIDFTYTNKQEVLERLNCIIDGKLINAAKIMFCQNHDIEIQMAIFATSERLTFIDIRRESGSIPDLIRIGEKYIKDNIRWRVEFDGSIEHKEIPEIPVNAIREVLVNSYCHKDYLIPQNNEITVFKDRIEIYNSGTFPDGLTPIDYINGTPRPYKRNPILAQLLYYPKDIESFDTGFKRIKKECDALGTEFDYQLQKYGFVFIFRRKEVKSEADEMTDKMTDKVTDIYEMTDKMTVRKRTILKYLLQNEFITNKVTCKLLNLSPATAKRTLKSLVEQGLLKSVGEKSTRKYFLANKEK